MQDMAPHEVRLEVARRLRERAEELRQEAAKLDLAVSELTHGRAVQAVYAFLDEECRRSAMKGETKVLAVVNQLYHALPSALIDSQA